MIASEREKHFSIRLWQELGHWLENDRVRRSACPAVRRVIGSNTSVSAKLIESIHVEFNLEARVNLTTITDNQPNYLKSCRIYQPDEQANHMGSTEYRWSCAYKNNRLSDKD